MAYMKIIILLAYLWIPVASAADTQPESTDEPHSVWLNPGFISHHFQRNMGFRENNYGLGFQVTLSQSLSVTAGYFRNSENYGSHYIGWIWQPLNLGSARIGLVGTAIDGYPRMKNGQWFLAALPIMSFEYRSVGINFTVIPTYQDKIYGALVAQFKFRIG